MPEMDDFRELLGDMKRFDNSGLHLEDRVTKDALIRLMEDPTTSKFMTWLAKSAKSLPTLDAECRKRASNQSSDASSTVHGMKWNGMDTCQTKEELMEEINSLERRNLAIQSEMKRVSSQQKQFKELNSTLAATVEPQQERQHSRPMPRERLAQLLDSLNVMETEAKQLVDLHRPEYKACSSGFPSSAPTSEYFTSEELHTTELTRYTKQQFFKGIADLMATREQLDYEFLDVAKPETYLIAGESETGIQTECEELQRLQDLFVTSERELLVSLCGHAAADASVIAARQQLEFLKAGRLQEMTVSSEGVDELASRVALKQDKMKEVFSNAINPILHELQQHQSTKVLRGNYELKIARQEYFMAKQGQVINRLINQCSRYEFLFMLYEVEANSIRDINHLLTAIGHVLESKKHTVFQSVEHFKELSHPHYADLARETIDSRDATLQTMFNLVVPPAKRDANELFITFAGLQQAFEGLVMSLQRQENALFSEQLSQDRSRSVMQSLVSQCVGLLQGEDPNEYELSEATAKLEALLNSVEKSLRDTLIDVDGKKQLLASDQLKAMSRNIFPLFMNDPSRLQRQFSELMARVKGMATTH